MRPLALILPFLFLTGCSDNPTTKETQPLPVAADSIHPKKADNTVLKTFISIYKYDSSYKDSSLVFRKWLAGDSVARTLGNFYYTLPIQSEFVDDKTVKDAQGQPAFETFDSLVCELGGRSAWNKYVFRYDDKKRPVLVTHYKAWYESVDKNGDFYINKSPQYFLGEQITYKYSDNKIVQFTSNDSGKIIERITKQFDANARLIFEEWDAWNEYRYRIYYNKQE